MSFCEKDAVRIYYEEAGTGFPLLVSPAGGLNSTIAGLKGSNSPFKPMEEFKGEHRCIARFCLDGSIPAGLMLGSKAFLFRARARTDQANPAHCEQRRTIVPLAHITS